MSAVEKVLAEHWVKSWGMGHGSPDHCACGERILPLPGDEDARVRRSQAHAAHVAQMLAPVLADVWDEGHRFTGYDPTPGENPYRAGGAS